MPNNDPSGVAPTGERLDGSGLKGALLGIAVCAPATRLFAALVRVSRGLLAREFENQEQRYFVHGVEDIPPR
jgi:hypothetical protein